MESSSKEEEVVAVGINGVDVVDCRIIWGAIFSFNDEEEEEEDDDDAGDDQGDHDNDEGNVAVVLIFAADADTAAAVFPVVAER